MDKAAAEKLLYGMMRIRRFEESVQYYFSLGMIHGTAHLGIGEEAAAAGSCAALSDEDYMYATHRGHGPSLAKGVPADRMMAEMFGRENGICKGRGGSMHIACPKVGAMGTNGVVGPSMALAAGSALAIKMRGEKRVALAFFGDGATNEGVFHETMNLAALWKLPVIFVCVNNTYGMSTHISRAMHDTDLLKRAVPYGIPAVRVDGNDVEAVYEAVKKAKEEILEDPFPRFIVEDTYRICGHSKSDGNLYRTKEEIKAWKEKDPIKAFSEKCISEGLLTAEEAAELERRAEEEIKRAVDFASAGEYPDAADLYEDVYAAE